MIFCNFLSLKSKILHLTRQSKLYNEFNFSTSHTREKIFVIKYFVLRSFENYYIMARCNLYIFEEKMNELNGLYALESRQSN